MRIGRVKRFKLATMLLNLWRWVHRPDLWSPWIVPHNTTSQPPPPDLNLKFMNPWSAREIAINASTLGSTRCFCLSNCHSKNPHGQGIVFFLSQEFWDEILNFKLLLLDSPMGSPGVYVPFLTAMYLCGFHLLYLKEVLLNLNSLTLLFMPTWSCCLQIPPTFKRHKTLTQICQIHLF